MAAVGVLGMRGASTLLARTITFLWLLIVCGPLFATIFRMFVAPFTLERDVYILTRDEAISISCGKVQRFPLDQIRQRRTRRVVIARTGFRPHEDPGRIVFAVETHQDDEGIEYQSEHGFLYLSAVSAAERAIEKMLHPTGCHQGPVT